MSTMKNWILAAAMVAPLALGACSKAQKGAAAGGALGGVAGGIVGANIGAITTTQGVLMGASGGAAVGGLTGDAFDQMTRTDQERELQNMRAELAAKEAELAKLQANPGSGDQVAALESENEELAAAKADLEGQIASLSEKLAGRERELAQATESAEILRTSMDSHAAELDRVKKELDDMNVKMEETNRGITLTIAEQFLYQPGRAELSQDGHSLMAKVAGVIQEQFPGREMIVEGHTDNQPIKHSTWKSNWELGSARALTILRELVDKHGFAPERLSATTYGEFHPEADNATAAGRRANRRAVILILPENLAVQKLQMAQN